MLERLHAPLTGAMLAALGASASQAAAVLPARPAALVHVQPGVARPGDPVLVVVRGSARRPSGALGAETLRFYPLGASDETFAAFVGLPLEQRPGPLALRVRLTAGGRAHDVRGFVTVEPGTFRSRHLTVARRFTSPSEEEKAWAKEDQVAFTRATSVVTERWAFEDAFVPPRPLVLSALFGDRRTINRTRRSVHYGVDLGGDGGEPIFAVNAGRVAMVRRCFGSGNTVLVDHGGALYSAYFHLTTFEVEEGALVAAGQRLGTLGTTGRVTGPHLHFGVKLRGRWVNPMAFFAFELSG